MSRILLVLSLLAAAATAGGGPETTLVVVNAASPVSRRVANEYAKLRDIPPSHLFHLEGVPSLGVVPLDFFLERMWKPIRAYMEAQGIADRIELVEWSADFPYAVDFSKRLGGSGNQGTGRHASLTGLVYLMRLVEDERVFWNAGQPVNGYFGLGTGRRGPTRRMSEVEFKLLNRAERALSRKGYADAAEAYRELLKTYDQVDTHWYNYACALARSGHPDEAMDALRKSVEHGWKRAGDTIRDPDLASLRDRPDFKRLVEGIAQIRTNPARAFARSDGHLLSVQLAYTGRWGNSLPEVLAYLRASAKSDGTHPDGTVYICKNKNVRSVAREPFFAGALARLAELGRKAELLDNTVIPQGKTDVIGAVVGTAGFSWAKSKSKFVPGAIAEHLTSFGAHFGTPGQTKITEFLRYGAAGSSGTVQEPLALWQKFPVPFIHAYYAEGLCLAEAFYYGVFNPYQLMVAGDGLARPFATFTKVRAKAPHAPWKGTITIETDADELWVDGRRMDSFTLDTSKLADGHHDVRVVSISDDAIRTRSYAKLDGVVDNHGRKVRVDVRKHEVRVAAPGAKECTLREGSRVVARAADGKLPLDGLVPGPVTLIPEVAYPDGSTYRGAPVELDVPAPAPAKAVDANRPVLPGLRGRWVDAAGKEHRVVVTGLGDARGGPRLLEQLPAKGVAELTLTGFFDVKDAGLYELTLSGAGEVAVGVGDEPGPPESLDAQVYRLVACAAGRQPLALTLKPKGRPNLEVLLGGARVLAPLTLWHAADPAPKDKPKVDKKLAILVDGKRAGAGVSADKLELAYRRSVKDVTSVTLFPGKDAKDLPRQWTVETTTGYGGWKPVKEMYVVVAPGEKKNAKDKTPPAPLFVRLEFDPVRAKKIRLNADAPAALAEVEVGVAPK